MDVRRETCPCGRVRFLLNFSDVFSKERLVPASGLGGAARPETGTSRSFENTSEKLRRNLTRQFHSDSSVSL